MPNVIGPAQKVYVTVDLAKLFVVDQSDNQTETFVLWSGAPASASERILRCKYLALAKEAVSQGKRVEVVHPNDSALVTSLSLLRA